MNRLQHLAQSARYNRWMNDKLYAAAWQLGEAAVRHDRGAFFGSIWGTLNHLVVADALWLQRLAHHEPALPSLSVVAAWPAPSSLAHAMADDLAGLQSRRTVLDEAFIGVCAELPDALLDTTLRFHSTQGQAFAKSVHEVLLHVFNHQTHHRGQATTLFTQAGMDVGVTDLLRLPELDAAR